MKKQFLSVKKIFPVLMMLITISSHSQSNPEYSFELTTSKTNIFSSRAFIDVPALTDNPSAIVVARLADNQRMSNPHPMGAWYYGGKWNLFNTDHAQMPVGLTFKITYYLKPDADQFVHSVNVIEREGSYINNARLNNNPNAKIDFFQIHGTKTNGLNPYEAEVFYSTLVEKWCIRNKDGRELTKNASFNIVVYATGSTPVTTTVVTDIAPAINPLITAGPLPTNITSGWTWNGNNINNTNSGFVGIGNNNPAYRLDVAGPMLVRSSGATTGSAGIWLNDDYNYKAGLMGMENDNHIGFFGVGINGFKFSMNTNTGALKINGSEGKPNQVLVSNGAAAPAYKTLGNVIRTEIKKTSASVEAKVSGTEYHLPQLTHTITLTAKSRIIISAQMSVTAHCVFYLCDASNFHLLLKVNNSIVFDQQYYCSMVSINPSISNYIIELNPGTHNLDFYDHFIGGNTHWITPHYSSIIILPVD